MLQGSSGYISIRKMTAELISPNHAAAMIAEAFREKRCCQIHVQEQRAFKERWLCLGTINLSPGTPDEDSELTAALTTAAFEWRLPSPDVMESKLASLLEIKPNDNDYHKIARALDQMAAIGVRSGLLHPTFDPDAVEGMPFRRIVTIVSDTSGVLQGALDFVVRYLHPAARVKIPSIVQMEFANLTERFLSIRRSNKRKEHNKTRLLRADELFEHLKSQGGQRSLLRFELLTDIEIERTYLLGDPLRSAFQPDSDSGLRELNISLPIRAYADRLVLEAARHHQAQSEPGHAVRLLTSDQGLARMALAEGMVPLYFSTVKRTDFFGTRLTGQTLNPFTGDVYSIPLVHVLWELANGFGIVRLQWDNGRAISISALSDDISWSPFHSVDDLLLFSTQSASTASPSGAAVSKLQNRRTEGEIDENVFEREMPAKTSFQRMNVNRLLKLICTLDENQTLDTTQVASLLGIDSVRNVGEYRRFLLSADLLKVDGNSWMITPHAQHLSAELQNKNASALNDAFSRSPSYAAFRERIVRSGTGHPVDMSNMPRSAATYRTIGEVALICASVGKNVYATLARPNPDRFAQIALKRFREIDRGHGLVATGRWLESLIEHEGIHPEIARRALEQASEMGLLRRSTEGSTTQTAFENHVVHVLRTDAEGTPYAAPVHLYRGDYLIPGKASVSVRIEELS